MNSGRIASILSNVTIFSRCGESELEGIAADLRRLSCKAGEVLCREGEPGDELFVIASGTVSVSVRCEDGSEFEFSRIGEGDFFGEMSVIEKAPRSATCRAETDCELLAFDRRDFGDMLLSKPHAAGHVLKGMLGVLTNRLLGLGSFVSQMAQWGDVARKRAITDPATGLFNRRYFEDSLEDILARSALEGKPVALVMFDMDHFGSLNKEYGLEFGDALIARAAGLFREVFDEGDVLVRHGGDEFAFVFPGASGEDAQRKCDALCRAFREQRFEDKRELRLTCSMGYAVVPESASSKRELLELADKALYAAKEAGRDRAVAAAREAAR